MNNMVEQQLLRSMLWWAMGLLFHKLQYIADIDTEEAKAKVFADDPVLFLSY